MLRFATLLAVVAIGFETERASAQPGLPATMTVVDAKVEKGKVQWTETQLVPVTKEVEVVVLVNGMQVTQKQSVTVIESAQVTREQELKGLKATGTDGKAIDADKLADLLKEKTPVVVVTGSLPEKHRALFKDKTVFIELPATLAPGGGPAPFPAPPVVVPAPGLVPATGPVAPEPMPAPVVPPKK